MLSKLFSPEDAVQLLDMKDISELQAAVESGELKYAESAGKKHKLLLSDLVMFRLSQVLTHVGVDKQKALRYAEAILESRLHAHEKNIVEWVENETQELFCYIADAQLSRIFLRNKDDSKEVDVGAVKPVLLPVTRCEINVFRVIRPVIYRAKHLLASK
jgi:hypothetical protein